MLSRNRNRQQPPILTYETSRLFKFNARISKPVSELSSSSSEVISANSDSTAYPSTIDYREEKLKRPSWNSLSSSQTARARSEPTNWDDFDNLDLELYPTSKETIRMIQESLGLLPKQKTCLKTQTSLVQELFAFVAENSAKEKKCVAFADPLITARYSLDGYYRMQMTRKIQQLESVEQEIDDENALQRMHSMMSVDSVDSAVLENLNELTSGGPPSHTISVEEVDRKSKQENRRAKEIHDRNFYKQLPPTPVAVVERDDNVWLDRDSPDEDTFSVSSTSNSSDSDVIEEQVNRLRRTKKFVLESTLPIVMKDESPEYFCPGSEDGFELTMKDTDTGYESNYRPSLQLEDAYRTCQSESPNYFQTISLRQSMEIYAHRVPRTQLSDGSLSPRIVKRSDSSAKPGFGGKVKQIFSRWF